MNFKRITLSLACVSLAVASFGQALTSRVFTYDGTVGTNGSSLYVLNGDGANAYLFAGGLIGSGNYNGVTGATTLGAAFMASTVVNVSSYIYISGNFGGVYTVQGAGVGYDIPRYDQVEIVTNRSLTFSASGFYALPNNVGTIGYTLSLLQDYPSNGNVIAGSGAALNDANFNGTTLNLNASQNLPADGRATLQLGRTLTLNQAATGSASYQVGGFILLGVN